MKKVGFLGIDYQNDFMDLPNSALPVPGANADAQRVATFLTKFAEQLTSLYFTQDSHHVLDIAHPSWWKNADGSFVSPFTMISSDDIIAGKYYAAVHPTLSKRYVDDLTAQGEYVHFVWPEHCLIGTEGHAFQKDIQLAIGNFERVTGRWVNVITKGSNPFTEHFGAFRANIPQANDTSTQISQSLLQQLNTLDVLYFTGEARSHCVANSLRQLFDDAPNLLLS
jgi:nicotinamidase-related amidase